MKSSKTEAVRNLLKQGKSVKEIMKATGCSDALVYLTRKQMFPDKVRKYKTRKKARKVSRETYKKVIKEAGMVLVKKLENDTINSPAHYTVGGIETYDFIRAKGLSYGLGNVVKYITRAEHKGATLYDLQKARWYLNKAIEEREAEIDSALDKKLDAIIK